jgi:formamidopyrimidine-DNA glycosylase
MPELPEVETVCRGLAARLCGHRLRRVRVRRHDLRQPVPGDFAARLTGRRVVAIDRRAKYMLWHLDDGGVVIGHLGMSGRMCVQPAPPPPLSAHDHVIFETDEQSVVVYNDPRRFGLLLLSTESALGKHALLRDLGPEPLAPAFTAATLRAALAGRRGPIKAALLDQTVVAGLGNIYVCEALYRARVSPLRAAGSLTAPAAQRLVHAIKDVLTAAIAAGGSTLRDYVQADGEIGDFQVQFAAYDREGEPCQTASCRGRAVIRRIVQSGRATYYCPRCQK